MDIRQHTAAMRSERMRAWEEAKAHLDDCQRRHPARPMNAEERRKWQRLNDRIDDIDRQVDDVVARDRRETESAIDRDAFDRKYGMNAYTRSGAGEADSIRAFLDGDGPRSIRVPVGKVREEKMLLRQGASPEEARTLVWDTGSSGSLVPTLLASKLYEYMEASMSMLRAPCTMLNTPNGDPLNIPKLASHAIGTQVIAQGTAIGGTDPTFAQSPLTAYKFGELVQVASEVVQDSAIDIIDFVARDVGRAVGRQIGTKLSVGTGTGEPQGLMVGLASAGSVTTGGSLIKPTYENLVDTEHTIADMYRRGGSAGWFTNDSTVAYLRKLRSDAGGTTGPILWSPSLTRGLIDGEPDLLLDYPVFTDPGVATLGSNARCLAFQDFNAYYIRHVGDFVFERSDDYAFNTDLVTFRGKWRVGGRLVDTLAGASLLQNV